MSLRDVLARGGGRTFGGGGALDGEEVGAGGGAQAAVRGFPEAEEQKGNDGGRGQDLGSGPNLRFRLPAEELLAQKEGQGRADRKRDDFGDNLSDADAGDHDAFETGNEISGRKEKREALDPDRQHGQRQRGAGKEEEGGPEDLVDDLSFLGAVGDAGDDQSQGGEGDNSQGDEEKDAAEISPLVHVENSAGQREFDGDGGQRQNVIGEDAGSEHGSGADRGHAETAQDALFAEGHQLDAQAPEAAHHGNGQHGGEHVRHGGHVTAGKQAQKQKQKDQRENQAEEDEGAVAQRQAHADLGQRPGVSQ